MGALNTKYEKKNVPKEKMNIENIQVNDSNRSDYELFEKVTHISKELYTLYHQHFLNENFCKQLSTIYKKKLFELDIHSLQNLYNNINTSSNSENSNSNKKLQAVLSYSPNENEKFIVEEFKTQLREYLWNQDIQMNPKIFSNKGIVLDNIPMTIIDPQNKLRYINISHINRILANVQKNKPNKNSGNHQQNINQNNNNNNKNQIGGANGNENNNESNSSFPFLNTSFSPSSGSSGSFSSLPFTNNQNINQNENQSQQQRINGQQQRINGQQQRINGQQQQRINGQANNFNAFKRKIEKVGRDFNLRNRPENIGFGNVNVNGNGKKNRNQNKSNIPFVVNNQINNNELQQFLNQIPNQAGKVNRGVPRKELEEQIHTMIQKNVNSKDKTTFNVRNYKQPTRFCTSGEKCMLTKSELCKAITEHFIIRGNIIASILSTLPYKTSTGFEGGYCYQRFLNLDKCQVCLPHNYNELMSMDPKTRIQTMMLFVNYMTEKECVENNGLFRKLTLGEKKSLLQHGRNGDEFNILYTEYTQNVRQKYIEHLNVLLEILETLSTMEGIQNEELNALSLKTKETIDSMVHLCQFYYLYAIIALLNANITPIKSEETNKKNQLRNNMKQFLVSL
jgi:hypothetical protein